MEFLFFSYYRPHIRHFFDVKFFFTGIETVDLEGFNKKEPLKISAILVLNHFYYDNEFMKYSFTRFTARKPKYSNH